MRSFVAEGARQDDTLLFNDLRSMSAFNELLSMMRSVVGGDQFAVFDVHFADARRQAELFLIFGRIH